MPTISTISLRWLTLLLACALGWVFPLSYLGIKWDLDSSRSWRFSEMLTWGFNTWRLVLRSLLAQPCAHAYVFTYVSLFTHNPHHILLRSPKSPLVTLFYHAINEVISVILKCQLHKKKSHSSTNKNLLKKKNQPTL